MQDPSIDNTTWADEQIFLLEQENAALRAKVAELERWIPVSERLPEEAGWYWCEVYSQLSKSYFRMAVFFNPHHHRGEKFEISTMNYAVSRYWDMPLPAPPEDNDG